jgi:hypothetical protein
MPHNFDPENTIVRSQGEGIKRERSYVGNDEEKRRELMTRTLQGAETKARSRERGIHLFRGGGPRERRRSNVWMQKQGIDRRSLIDRLYICVF